MVCNFQQQQLSSPLVFVSLLILLTSILEVAFANEPGTNNNIAMIIASGWWSSCIVFPVGTVKCFGLNSEGQLGYGDKLPRGDKTNSMSSNLPVVDLGPNAYAVSVDCGSANCCAILSDGKMKCWGRNNEGQLGIENTNNMGDDSGVMGSNLPYVNLGDRFVPKSVVVGFRHTCVLSTIGDVKCFGFNNLGQLGSGSSKNTGGSYGSMGNNLPKVDLGSSFVADEIYTSSEASHNCAKSNEGMLKCWGFSGFGILGYGDTASRGGSPSDMGDNLPFVNVGSNLAVKSITIGATWSSGHTCAILNNMKVKCWGANQYGQLGYGDTIQRGDETNEMGDNLPIIDLGTGRTVLSLTAGGFHTCALLDDYRMKCFGRGDVGQLGIESTSNQGNSPNTVGDMMQYVMLPSNDPIYAISSGEQYTCAVMKNGIKCFGNGAYGNLGNEKAVNIGTNVGEMSAIEYISLGSGERPHTPAPTSSYAYYAIILVIVVVIAYIILRYIRRRRSRLQHQVENQPNEQFIRIKMDDRGNVTSVSNQNSIIVIAEVVTSPPSRDILIPVAIAANTIPETRDHKY